MLRHSTERLVRTSDGLHLNPRLVSHALELKDGGYGTIASPATADTSFRSPYATKVAVLYVHDWPPATGTEWYVLGNRTGGSGPDGRWKFALDNFSTPALSPFTDEGASAASTTATILPINGWVAFVWMHDNNNNPGDLLWAPLGSPGPLPTYTGRVLQTDTLKTATWVLGLGNRGDGIGTNPQMALGFVGLWSHRWTVTDAEEFAKNLRVPEGETQLMMYPGVGADGSVENWGSHVPASRQLQRMTYNNFNGLPYSTYIEMPLLPIELEDMVPLWPPLSTASSAAVRRRFNPLILR